MRLSSSPRASNHMKKIVEPVNCEESAANPNENENRKMVLLNVSLFFIQALEFTENPLIIFADDRLRPI